MRLSVARRKEGAWYSELFVSYSVRTWTVGNRLCGIQLLCTGVHKEKMMIAYSKGRPFG